MSANLFEEDPHNLASLIDDDENLLDKATQLFMGSEDEEEDNQQIYFSDENMDDLMLDDNDDDDENEEDPQNDDFGFESDEEYDIDDEDLVNDSHAFKNAIRAAGNFRTKKKKGSAALFKRKMLKSKDRELDPEVRILLSQANEAFVRNDFQVSLNLYLEVVRKDPKNFSAYKTLGEIYKQQGKQHECCNYWFLAANIHPWDNKFWGTVAELSSELGHTTQAVYCYGRAIVASNNQDLKAIFDRAVLYRELKQYGRALESFQKLHQLLPEDTLVIKELAMVYVFQQRTNDAIDMYMRILDENMHKNENKGKAVATFTWSELNILAELYDKQKSWKLGVRIIKLVARWLQNRSNESWWDDTNDDIEFDERRVKNPKYQALSPQAKAKPRNLPIDIRIKLGFFRLSMKDKEEAMLHFNFLFSQNIKEIADLHLEVGKALEETGDYDDALKFLEPLSYTDEFNTQELVLLLAKCLQETGDYHQAERAYSSILQVDPENLDVKLALAEVLYHLGEIGKSQILLRAVTESRKSYTPTGADAEGGENLENLAMISNKKMRPSKRSTRLTEEQRAEIERTATKKVLEKYGRMKRFEKALVEGDKVGISAWIQLASQLVEMFMNIKNFFPRDKSKLFRGILSYRRKKDMGFEEKLARVYNLYEGINNSDEGSRSIATSTTEFRGIVYDDWFFIFMQYALILAKFESSEDALAIAEAASNVSVFFQNKERDAVMRMVKLSIGISVRDYHHTVMSTIRVALNAHQFSPTVYKLFMFCLPSGNAALETFASFNHQKFFLRQVKAFDSLKNNEKITGMATITNSKIDVSKDHPHLFYIYSTLLASSKSYVPSLVYSSKIYKEFSKDPLICFTIGLAHVHRSMQRLASNRHLQLLQGMSYIFEYVKLRSENGTDYELQEVEFNLGKLYHLLGLFSLAVNHYEKVLEFKGLDEEYDLKMEAAYNLSLIYHINGNPKLAADITKKYLTI